MGRGKIKIERIENTTKRQVTFSKRRSGLFKKTKELSILCDVQIGLIVFSPTAKLFQFASYPSTMEQIIQRYQTVQGVQIPRHNNQEELASEVQHMRQQIHDTQLSLQHLLAEDLHSSGPQDLNEREQLLEYALQKIRARKAQLQQQQLENLRRSEKKMEVENNDMFRRWLMGSGQYEEQQELPFYGGEELGSMLQLSTLPPPPPPQPQAAQPPVELYSYGRVQPNLEDLSLCIPQSPPF